MNATTTGLASDTPDARHVYHLRCPLKPVLEVNKDGCGWEPAKEDDDFEEGMSRISMTGAVAELRKAVHDSEGQELAQYCDDANVKAIDVVVVDHDHMDFYVHFAEKPSNNDLAAFREDFLGQLSDGWGENFDGVDLGLRASHSRSDRSWKLGMGFDWDKLSQPVPYNPATMPSMEDIDLLKKVTAVAGAVRRYG